MFTEVTRKIVAGAIGADPCASDEEKAQAVQRCFAEAVSRVVTIREACERLRCTRPTIWRLCKSGKLRGVQGNGRNMRGISERSLVAYVEGGAA